VASLFQFRTRIVPEPGVHAVRFRQRRLAVLRRDVLPLQKPGEVSHRNGVHPGEHLSRIFLHMLLFPVHLRADHNGHMVQAEQAVDLTQDQLYRTDERHRVSDNNIIIIHLPMCILCYLKSPGDTFYFERVMYIKCVRR